MFYLPLDKLLEKSAAHETEQPAEASGSGVPKEQDTVTIESRGRGELMPTRAFPVIIVIGVLLFIAATSLFTVGEAELAIRTEFGAIVGCSTTLPACTRNGRGTRSSSLIAASSRRRMPGETF